MTGEKDGWMPQDNKLQGPSNIAVWILTITAILMSLGLSEFLQPRPDDLAPAAQRKWELTSGSDHTKAYGHVIKNIGNAALQTVAISHQQERKPLHDLLTHFRSLQRTEIEINSDIDTLTWTSTDDITGFFQRGQRLFNEMLGAHPGALTRTTGGFVAQQGAA